MPTPQQSTALENARRMIEGRLRRIASEPMTPQERYESTYSSTLGGMDARATAPKKETPRTLTQGERTIRRLETQQRDKDDPLRGEVPYPGSALARSDTLANKELFPERFKEKKTLVEQQQEKSDLFIANAKDKYFREGMDALTPQQQGVIYDEGYEKRSADIKPTPTEPVSGAITRINKELLTAKKLTAENGDELAGLAPEAQTMFAALKAAGIGADSKIDIGEVGRKAALVNITAYEDTLSNLTNTPIMTDPVKRRKFNITTYQDYFRQKTALDNAIQGYDTVLNEQGQAAADKWLAQEADGANIDDLSFTHRMFTPAVSDTLATAVSDTLATGE